MGDRLQLVLVCLANGLHKATGTLWLDGTVMGVAAPDPEYGPGWLSELPILATPLNYGVLSYQFLFPIAIWFRPMRLPLLFIGVLFHLGTVVRMDIPGMGMAFIVADPIRSGDDEAAPSEGGCAT